MTERAPLLELLARLHGELADADKTLREAQSAAEDAQRRAEVARERAAAAARLRESVAHNIVRSVRDGLTEEERTRLIASLEARLKRTL